MKELLEKYVALKYKIAEIIDYPGTIQDNIIPLLTDTMWYINNGVLVLNGKDEYIISSLNSKGVKLYKGVDSDYMYVKAYNANTKWYDTNIYILNLKNKVNE